MKPPFTLNWGVLATGDVAEAFSKDLLTDPASREVHDVIHRLVAVASRNVEKARDFLRRIDAPGYSTAYGSYIDLVSDSNVDVVYVATPHSHHFHNVLMALKAGKHVLCEKPFTVTAGQARLLVNLARQKSLFLMEAVWTRFQPLSREVCRLVAAGEIGAPTRVLADLSFNNISESDENRLAFPDSHRKVNPELAGGTLLTLGIYPLTWIFMILYHLQTTAEKEQPTVLAAANQYYTGIDNDIALVLHFQQHGALGVATSSLRVATAVNTNQDVSAIRIQGSRGEIRVSHPAFQPTSFTLVKKGLAKKFEYLIPKDKQRDNWGHGFFWEADEVARCIMDGKTESEIMPLDETVIMSEVMEESLRQGGIVYPASITGTTAWPDAGL